MKISFSTLGCPEWSWDDMLATAKDIGFNGIEIRGIENELHAPRLKPFNDTNMTNTKAKLERMDLEIPCLTSSCYLFDKSNIQAHIDEGKEYIDLASRMGTPFVRVLGDMNPQPGTDIEQEYVAANLSVLAKYAEGKNVKVIIETNGVFADSDEMAKLMESIGSSNVGVLWDVHHPYRFKGESVEKTYNALKDYICFVHVKDSIMENGQIKYKMMGHGDIPVEEAMALLKSSGYTGYVSLEWVKRWCIELEDPGVVFSHFVNYMQNFAG